MRGYRVPTSLINDLKNKANFMRNCGDEENAKRVLNTVEAIEALGEEDLDSEWHTGVPAVEEVEEGNQYCYALCLWYDGWWLSDYLFRANHEEGCFETDPKDKAKYSKFKFSPELAYRKITPYKEI